MRPTKVWRPPSSSKHRHPAKPSISPCLRAPAFEAHVEPHLTMAVEVIGSREQDVSQLRESSPPTKYVYIPVQNSDFIFISLDSNISLLHSQHKRFDHHHLNNTTTPYNNTQLGLITMLVKFANIVAISFAAFGVQQAIATPVHDTESHDIARRTKSLKCGWVKSKHGKDLGCLCDSILGNVNADFDLGDVLSLVFGKSSKSYPPGCKPTCDVSPCRSSRSTRASADYLRCTRSSPSRAMEVTNVLTARTARETASMTMVAREAHAGTTASVAQEEPSTWAVFGELGYGAQTTLGACSIICSGC